MVVALLQARPTLAGDGILWLEDLLLRWHAPAFLSAPGRAEAILNTALFLPPAALTVLAFPRFGWAKVAAVGFVASLSVEIVQGLFLVHRTPQAIDVVTNSTGAFAGALLGWLLLPRKDRSHS